MKTVSVGQQALDMLGHEVRDRVTGAVGVVISVSFDLSGCVQAWLSPKVNEKGEKQGESIWMDTKRAVVLSSSPVLTPPVFFEVKAGSERGCVNGKASPERS